MLENPEAINKAFQDKYGDGRGMKPGERMNKRNEVAKELLESDFKREEANLAQRAKEAHEKGLREWKLELNPTEKAEDVHLYVLSSYHPLVVPD